MCVGDGEADGECAAVAEAAVDGPALAVPAGAPAVAAALAEAAASAAFLADTAVVSSKNNERARAKPTINVMTGVAIFTPRGTHQSHRMVQRSAELAENP